MSARLGLPRGQQLILDAGIAAVCAGLLVDREFVGWGEPRDIVGSPAWTFPLLLLPSVALLWRRTRPVVCVAGFAVPYALHAALTGHGVEGAFALLPGLVALYSLGAYAVGRALALGTGIVVAGYAVHDANDPLAFPDQTSAWAYLFFVAVAVGVLLAGVVVGARRRAAAARLAEAEAETRRADAVASERAKIARELHDVVTHNVNVVVLQAMAASGVLESDPARVREPLRAIETSGREALAEMRRMLGVLREDADPLLGPQPGAADVGRLVESLRAAGQQVSCRLLGDLDHLPEGMGVVVYRIVQEALTNTLKHASGSPATVEVRAVPGAVEVEVVDRGGGAGPDSGGLGHGLIGMRERAALFGGSVEAGRTPDGGFRVLARLPLPSESA